MILILLFIPSFYFALYLHGFPGVCWLSVLPLRDLCVRNKPCFLMALHNSLSFYTSDLSMSRCLKIIHARLTLTIDAVLFDNVSGKQACGRRSCQGVIIHCHALKASATFLFCKLYYSCRDGASKKQKKTERWKCNDTFGYQQ